MDSKINHATCMGAAVTVIAAGVAIIERERSRIYIPREPRINAIAQREFYVCFYYVLLEFVLSLLCIWIVC